MCQWMAWGLGAIFSQLDARYDCVLFSNDNHLDNYVDTLVIYCIFAIAPLGIKL